ncbi:hypothetical protein KAU11_08210 [Candidatus Babeliales bacterium]|nr:hypothetical protein [Candidatus Babeliales bacterium]
MKFQLAINNPEDVERLKELLHTHPLKHDGINPIGETIFHSREAVDTYWGDYIPTDFPYLFVCEVKDSFGAGGFGSSPGSQVMQLLPLKGTHTFSHLDRIKNILEDEEYSKVCKELNTRNLTNWDTYHMYNLELEACQRGRV